MFTLFELSIVSLVSSLFLFISSEQWVYVCEDVCEISVIGL